MQSQSAIDLPGKSNRLDRKAEDYLSFQQIEEQYLGTVQAETLFVWDSTHRNNFHRIVTKVGRNSRVRRDLWDKFLTSRTIGASREWNVRDPAP